MKIGLASYFIVLFWLSCQNPASESGHGFSEAENEKTESRLASSRTPPQVMKLVTHSVIDKEGTGLVASTYLLPEDWTVQDRLYWEYNDATVPVRFKAQMQNKDGSMSIQVFPDVRSSWNSGPSGTWGYRPPADFVSGMKELIAAERKGKNIRYIEQKLLVNDAQRNMQGGQWAQSGVMRVEYEENGKLFEEEFYGRLDVAEMNTPSAMGNMQSILWSASSLYACKAEKGKLDDCRKIAQTVASSARLTKPFFNRLSQVIQLLSDQVYAQIYQAGQISRIISQTNDRMIANIDASYRQSQQSAARTNNQFSDYIRGVDRYDEGGSEVQLPSGYQNAWVNDKGEYLLSTAPGYNPADDFYGNWRALRKQ